MRPTSPPPTAAPGRGSPSGAARNAGLERAWRGRTQGHWWLVSGGAAAAVVLAVLGFFLTPAEAGVGTHEQLGLPACAPMQLFDVPCPGCGVTTSVTLAAQGRLAESFANQPFGFLVALSLGGLVAFAAVGLVGGRDLYRDLAAFPVRPKLLFLALGAIVVASWAYKLLLVRGLL